jgi:arsenite methyltransferase
MEANTKYNLVEEHYSAHVNKLTSDNTLIDYNQEVAASFGYSLDDLKTIPTESNLGVSCGNPLSLANLKEGEVVVDLGSGGGIDVFLAAKKVGPHGKSIGIDMLKEMIKVARTNAEKGGYTNVEFIEARITDIPLKEETADVVISNCVLNLVPDDEKPTTFKEIYRLLKSGGRVAISDLLSVRELPDTIKNNLAFYVGCVSGARSVGEYEKWLKEAGFLRVVIVNTNKDLNVYKEGALMSDCAQKTSSKDGSDVMNKDEIKDVNFNDYIGSYQIYALKD